MLLYPHGGDLGGFILVRGSETQIGALRAEDEFERVVTRASLVVKNVGVVDAALGDGMQDAISVYQAAVTDLDVKPTPVRGLARSGRIDRF